MVVGAYTIINTIGLLVGLPLELTPTYNHPIIDINHNADIVTQDNVNNYVIILDTKDTVKNGFYPSLNENFTLTLQLGDFAKDFYFDDVTSVDDYLVYVPDSGTDVTDPYTIDIDFSSGISFATNHLIIEQIYLAQKTDTLSNMNGESIINSITSGLGLMGDITNNFKNGFSGLFWNSTDNKLTTFSNFALIFLGVSITFAIIKLCLNLIRSKTGV